MAVTDFLGNFDPKIALVGAFAPRTAQRMRNEKNRKKILELLNVDDDLLATQQQASALAQEQEALDAKAADISNMLQDEASITAMTESEIQQLREDAAFPRTNMTDQETKNVETLRQMEAGPTPLPITGEEIRQLRAQKSGQQQLDVAEKKLEEAGLYKGNVLGLTNERAKMFQDVLAQMPADVALDTFGSAVKQQLSESIKDQFEVKPTILSKKQTDAFGFAPNTIVQRNANGSLSVLQAPDKPKEAFVALTAEEIKKEEDRINAGITDKNAHIRFPKNQVIQRGVQSGRLYFRQQNTDQFDALINQLIEQIANKQ
jgi:hypothetical protein